MFLRDFGKFDRILLALALLFFLGAAYFIVDDDWLLELSSSEIAQLEKIGHVKDSKNDVRRRTKNTFYWLSLKREKDVYQDDSIFTGSDSEALITTDRGEEIAIAPNSLVVISATADSIFLDIDYGSVLGKIGKDSKLLIGSKDGISEFSGENGVIKIDVNASHELTVSVLQGQVQWNSGGEAQALGPQQSKRIRKGDLDNKRNKGAIELISPLSKRVLNSPSDIVSFSWKTEEEFKGYKVQAATDEKFENLVLEKETDLTHVEQGDLPLDQVIYWRVTGRGDQESISQSGKFSLTLNKPPRIDFPWAGLRMNYERDENGEDPGLDVTFKWQGPHQGLWEWQLSEDADFKKIVKESKVKDNHVLMSQMHSGSYFWRVRVRDVAEAPWSQIVDFQIRIKDGRKVRAPKTLAFKAPHIIETKNSKLSQAELASLGPKRLAALTLNPPEFQWDHIHNATNYQLEISRQSDFATKLVEAKVKNPKFAWKTARPGDYFWRVRSLSARGDPGEYSRTELVQIRIAPPQSATRAEITEQVSEFAEITSRPPPFKIKWKPTIYTPAYELEFANNSNFTQALRTRVEGTEKKVQAPTPGSYFWRVRSLDKSGEAISAFSAAFPIKFFRLYHNPAQVNQLHSLNPAQDAAVVLVGKGKNSLRLLWTDPFKGGPYRVQLSTEPDFEEVQLEQLVKNNRWTVENDLAPGWIYWRIRLESGTVISPWTGTSRFRVTYEKDGFQFNNANILAGPKRFQKPKPAPVKVEQEDLSPPIEVVFDPNFEFRVDPSRLPAAQDLPKVPIWEKWISEWPRFTWPAVREAEGYQLQLARDANFTDMVKSVTQTETSFQWNDSKPGVYFLRVRTLGKNPSPFSPPQSIQLETEEPRSMSPLVYVQELRDPRRAPPEPSPVMLNWTPRAFARNYEIEVRGGENRKWIAPPPPFALKIPKFGHYQWRLRALDKFQRPISGFSNFYPLEVYRTYRSPAAVPKLTMLFPAANQELRVGSNSALKLPLLWQSPQGQAPVRVQVSKDGQFKETLLDVEKQDDRLEMSLSLSEGTYFWRVGTRRSQGGMDWTSPQRFRIKNQAAGAPANEDKFWSQPDSQAPSDQ